MAKNKIKEAKVNFTKDNDVQTFYNRIIQAATNTQDTLLPSKVHGKDLSRYPTEDAYERSLAPAVEFSKKYPDSVKKSFDVIIYNKSNNDGIMSAYIAWSYLKFEAEKKDLEIYRLTSERSFGDKVSDNIQKILPKLRGKNVILFDLFYNRATYEAINSVTNLFIAIDDHHAFDQSLADLDYRFAIKDHAACVGAWKFFYPDQRVPYYVQYIDAGDSFGHYKWLPQINNFMTVFAVRFTKNQKKPEYQKDPEKLFEAMREFFYGKDVTAINFLVVLGQIMNEIRDNIKNEISNTATKATFTLEGRSYPIFILNFSSPGLTKQVLKNVAARHPEVPFVMSWFYNHNYKNFDITLSNAHMESGGPDLGVLAQKLGRMMGGSGGGHKNQGHVTFKGKISALDRFIR